MPRKKTHEEYVVELKEVNPNIEVVDTYINASTKIKHRCLIDEYEWETTPHNLLQGYGCPKCGGAIKKTHEQFIEEIKGINPNIEIVGEYVNNSTKIKCRCLIDGYEWDAFPGNLLRGHGCSKCGGQERYTTDSFKEKLKEINPNIEVLDEYVDSHTKIKCRCLIDGYEWETAPSNLLSNKGCPRCAKKERYTAELFKEKLKEINPNIKIIGKYINNSTKIKCRCLIDGYEWEAWPNVLLRGSGCPRCAHTGESWMQQFIYYSFKQVYNDVLYRDTTLIGMELDIVIPDIKLAIEPGGWYWHKNRVDKDLEKRDKVIAKGYNIITIYDVFDELEKPYEDCIVFKKDLHQEDIAKNSEKLLENLVKDLFKQFGIEKEINFDKVREECK